MLMIVGTAVILRLKFLECWNPGTSLMRRCPRNNRDQGILATISWYDPVVFDGAYFFVSNSGCAHLVAECWIEWRVAKVVSSM